MRLKGKHIILGITGSIAAYKAAILLRLFAKEGAEVQVVMTPSAKEFITPVTLSALSGKPVASEFFSTTDGTWHSHVEMGQWADLMIIAPATASTIGKMANGISENLLVTTFLSAKCMVLVAPAMDLDMYRHPANLHNIEILKSYGIQIIEAREGELASGLYGKGRMEEPEIILEEVIHFFNQKKKLTDKHFLVTAGPTYEKIDPVRFIGNYSSGKMGYAIANELALWGAKVTLVSGPVTSMCLNQKVELFPVESANEMYEQCIRIFPETDGAVMAAAVADYSPVIVSDSKIKKQDNQLIVHFKPTHDIAAELGRIKSANQILVGFALETNDEMINAFKKLQKKNLDFIVLNSLNDQGAGFRHDTNKVTLIDKDNKLTFFELKSKAEVATDIVNYVMEEIDKKAAKIKL
jgi:phosphopantothenoylcysteine decarboxylase/phosphopantothenate--cysteine ligase